MILFQELAPQKCNNNISNKTSQIWHSNTMESSHSLDGNEGPLPGRTYSIPHIIWKPPPKFTLNEDWEVAAGEESRESAHQKQRELAVLEAVYPRKTSIPSSPSSLPATEVPHRQDDHHEAPLIPVVPMEDTNLVPVEDTNNTITPMSNTKPTSSFEKPLSTLPSMEADVPAAASVVLTAILKSSEQGSLIDTNLLIKILNDPKMLDKLTPSFDTVPQFQNKEMADSPSSKTSHSPSSSSQTSDHTTTSLMGTHFRMGIPHLDSNIHISNIPPMGSHPNQADESISARGDVDVTPEARGIYSVSNNGSFWRENASVLPFDNGIMPYSFKGGEGMDKGGNYYKSLVNLHGGEREKDKFIASHLMLDDVNRTEEVKQSSGKDSLYFQTPVGEGDISCYPFENDIQMAKRWRRSY